LDVLQKLKTDIPTIRCKLEKIFPPALFDVMIYLTVHLPEEEIPRGMDGCIPLEEGYAHQSVQ
jgi:hypothetical protein